MVSQQAHQGVDHDGESDTESLGGASDVEDVGEVLEPTVVETPVLVCSLGQFVSPH